MARTIKEAFEATNGGHRVIINGGDVAAGVKLPKNAGEKFPLLGI